MLGTKPHDDSTAPSVFLSYRRADEPWLTQVLADKFRAAFGDDNVFIDLTSIAPGAAFADEIDRALAEVTAVIVVIGSDWGGPDHGYSRLFDDDDWVRREVAGALRSSALVIPLIVGTQHGQSEGPSGSDLPPDLADLADRNNVPITPTNRDQVVRRLVLEVWRRFRLQHDTVYLGSERHRLLVSEFVTALEQFAANDVIFASQLATSNGVPDFSDAARRPVLVALLPDAEEWNELNPEIRRLLKSRRYYRLLVVGTGVSSAFLRWDETAMRLAGSAADEITSLAESADLQLRMVNAPDAVIDGHLVDDPTVVADLMADVTRWITPTTTGAPPPVDPIGPIRRVARWFRRGLAEGAPATVVTTAAVTIGIAGFVYVVWPTDPDPVSNLEVVVPYGTIPQPETQEIYIMHADGTEQRQLTDNDYWDSEPDLFDDRLVTFASDRDGDSEIHAMNADGTDVVQLTHNTDSDWCPAWSPDGREIAFTSDRSGNSDVYVMNADGSNQRQVTDDPANDSCPTWSPDGEQLAFAAGRDGDWNVYTIALDDQNVRRITDDPAADVNPSWSPSGDLIAFASDRSGNEDIYLVGTDRSTPTTRLTHHAAVDFDPEWANPEELMFTSGRGIRDDGNERYVINIDGSDLRRLTSINDCDPDERSTCNPQ